MRETIILASRSPRRQLLLKQIGVRFKVRPSRVKEALIRNHSPSRNVRRIAGEKARDVASRVRRGTVVGADTIVVLGKRILGKPKSSADAKRMLRALSGRSHLVLTGLALVNAATGKSSSDVVKTRVWFRKLRAAEIREYVASGSPLDKAGSYGIQDDFGAVFVEKIEGCFYNVVGFPLTRFYRMLKRFQKQPIRS